jgi:hypothetical protein
MHVHIPQARQHAHPFGRDDFGLFGHGECAELSDGFDALALDDNDAVAQWLAAVAINQRAAD